MKPFSEILDDVKGRIAAACARAHREASEVEMVAVTKTHGADVVREAYEAGLSVIGENKVQEAAWKKSLSPAGLDWHLIGHLQGNKVRHALQVFDVIHSVDSAKLLMRLQQLADEMGKSPRILLEVNVSGEKSKTGMPLADVDEAVRTILDSCPRLTFEGFMTMAPFSEDPEDARPYFRRLRELRDETEKKFSLCLPRLSMGMSGDFEVAIEEGATWVRLGTVLFGSRPKLKRPQAEGDEASFGGLDSYSGAGPTVRILD